MLALAIVLRIGKILSVVLLCTGALGASSARSYEDRQRAAHWLAVPAFFGVWGFGLGLSHFTGVRLFSWWLLGSGLCSIVAINGVLYAVGREERATRGARWVCLLPLAIALILMVWRP